MEAEAGIVIAAQAVVGAALIALALTGALLIKRLGRLPLGPSGGALLIAFSLIAGLALIWSVVAGTLPGRFPRADYEKFFWLGAAVLAPLAGVAAVLLIRAVIRMPSAAELERRVAAHRRTLDKLRETRQELEDRVATRSREVYEAKKRLELALRDSKITICMLDRDLRYVWIRNAPAGFDAQHMIGKTDAELLPDGSAAHESMTMKQHVIETGEERRSELVIDDGRQTRYFDVTAEPYWNEDGSVAGVLCISVEETEQKEREERLRSVLREMSHRSKNTLTILLGIARQTAQRSNNLQDFMESFDARLRALVGSQDLLVEHDWRAIPLDQLLRTQIRPYLMPTEKRLQLDGPDVRIRAEPAQNLGLAVHELARNAHSFGALSGPKGQIRVHWSLEPEGAPKSLKIVWQEYDGPEVTPPTTPPGFGRTMTERILSRALDGHASINYRPEGVVCEIEVSMAHVEVCGA